VTDSTRIDAPVAVKDTLVERALHWLLCKLFKRRDIIIGGELYLRRWFVTPRHWPIRVFLHCIRKPDDQGTLHDHPWDFTTLSLARGYSEIYYDYELVPHIALAPIRCLKRRNSSFIRSLAAEHTHAVDPKRGPAWTLVFARRSRRVWGFHTPEGWVDWRTFLGLPPETPDHLEDEIR
jgi:hypothetical protein